MPSRCRCGSHVRYRSCQVACIECGEGCCPSCTVVLESATYCGGCAESLLAIPTEAPEARGRRAQSRRFRAAGSRAVMAGTR
jgi:hypothetical protein